MQTSAMMRNKYLQIPYPFGWATVGCNLQHLWSHEAKVSWDIDICPYWKFTKCETELLRFRLARKDIAVTKFRPPHWGARRMQPQILWVLGASGTNSISSTQHLRRDQVNLSSWLPPSSSRKVASSKSHTLIVHLSRGPWTWSHGIFNVMYPPVLSVALWQVVSIT